MPSLNQQYWDKYVTEQFPRQADRDDVRWPGDEWGAEQRWMRSFETLFQPAEVENWKNAVEIGQGSGKYTKLVFDAAPECKIAAFDVSSEYLSVCGERLAEEKEAGRLHLEHLKSERADEMILALERLGMAHQLDGFFSMDAMVHVDLQYLMAYFLTASVALREGGYLIMTLADSTTDRGFDFLVSRIARFYGQQGQPVGKFEWISNEIVRSVLGRLGFEIVKADNPPHGTGRDIHLLARLADPTRGRDLSWALCDEPGEQRQAERFPASEAPTLRWPAVEGAAEYSVEFSLNKFGTVLEPEFGPVRLADGNEFTLPDSFWADFQHGRPLHWRVIGECPDRRRVANRGIVVRVET
jgi:cyclopropane fatty-acyl-phospholipid synthase-like methyltransferase